MAQGPPQIGSNVTSPYFAPWATQFNSFSTQQITLPVTAGTTKSVTSPTGQWWRIPIAGTDMVTSTAVGNRLVYMEINPPGAPLYEFGMPGVQSASIEGLYTWGIGLNAFTTVNVAGNLVGQSPLVDVIWPPGTSFAMRIINPLALDGFGTATLGAEIYTEYVANPATGASVLIPTPVLT